MTRNITLHIIGYAGGALFLLWATFLGLSKGSFETANEVVFYAVCGLLFSGAVFAALLAFWTAEKWWGGKS